MDVFGTVSNVATLVESIIKTYRHIAESSSFAAEAAILAAMISFEYFRFEAWAEQSRYLLIDDGSVPTAGDQAVPSTPLSKYELQMAEKTHEVVAQISLVLEDISRLLAKYNMLEPSAETNVFSPQHQRMAQLPTSNAGGSSETGLVLPPTVASHQSVKTANDKISRLRLRLDRETGRLRKINFGWSLRNEISDKKKLQEFIQQLKYWNDALRENMPIVDQRFTEVITQVRVLSLATTYADCEGMVNSSGVVGGTLTALHLAFWNGRVTAAAALIKAGASLTIANRPFATPLHSAATQSTEIVKLLLATERVNVNALNASGLAPLHCASSAETAELLLQHGANVYRSFPRGQPAVSFAAEAGRHEVLALLLPRSPKWLSNSQNVSNLWMLACQNKHHEVFQALLDFGFKLKDLDYSLLIPMVTEAALKGNDQTLLTLIDYISTTNSLSEPSLAFRILMMAVKGSCVESTRSLAALRGIHDHDVNGWKPLLLAAKAEIEICWKRCLRLVQIQK